MIYQNKSCIIDLSPITLVYPLSVFCLYILVDIWKIILLNIKNLVFFFLYLTFSNNSKCHNEILYLRIWLGATNVYFDHFVSINIINCITNIAKLAYGYIQYRIPKTIYDGSRPVYVDCGWYTYNNIIFGFDLFNFHDMAWRWDIFLLSELSRPNDYNFFFSIIIAYHRGCL